MLVLPLQPLRRLRFGILAMSFLNSIHWGLVAFGDKNGSKTHGLFWLGQINDSFKMMKTVDGCWYILDLFSFAIFVQPFYP